MPGIKEARAALAAAKAAPAYQAGLAGDDSDEAWEARRVARDAAKRVRLLEDVCAACGDSGLVDSSTAPAGCQARCGECA